MSCPFVRAVSAGDLDTARKLSFADGEPCEDAVFEQLVEWARRADVGAPPRSARCPVAPKAKPEKRSGPDPRPSPPADAPTGETTPALLEPQSATPPCSTPNQRSSSAPSPKAAATPKASSSSPPASCTSRTSAQSSTCAPGSVRGRRTFDIRPITGPSCVADCRRLPVRSCSVDAIMCDPPYGQDYAEALWGLGKVYPTPIVLLRECARILRPGGTVAFLHQLVPIIPAGLDRVGTWGVSTGPGYRMRALTIATRCAEALPFDSAEAQGGAL